MQDFGANGIRVGYVISQANRPLLHSLESQSYFTCPSAFADRAAADLLSDTAFINSFTATNSARLASNYKLTTRFLDANDIPYHKGSNAGFFLWVDLFPVATAAAAAVTSGGQYLREARDATEESLRADEARLQNVLLEHRVFLSTGKTFGTEVPGWFRIAFAYEQAYLLEGLERVVRATKAFGRQIAVRQEKLGPVIQAVEEIRPQMEGVMSS
jgi:aspartate/methionine/tyrosine aminotransferase